MKTHEPKLPNKFKKNKRKLSDKDILFCNSMRNPVRLMTLRELAEKFKVSSYTILVHTNEKYRLKQRKSYLRWMKNNKKKPLIVKTRRKNERRRYKIKTELFPKKMKEMRRIKREFCK